MLAQSGYSQKLPLDKNVLIAAKERLEWVFDTFESICLSFSGGKDSTVLLHLLASEALVRKRTFKVLFIDWEVQYQATIDHVDAMRKQYRDCIDKFYWVCLPMTTVSSVSQYQPEWTAWAPNVEWVRQPPEGAITEPEYFPFYVHGMTFD